MRLPKHPLWPMLRFAKFEDGGDTGDGGDGGLAGDPHWSDSHEVITSNVELHDFAKRYDSEGAMAKAGYEARSKLGSSFRLPDDLKTLSEDQKGELSSRMKTLKTVPENAEGYEVNRPDMPDGLTYDESFESSVREFAHQRGWENKEVQEIMDFLNSGVVAAHTRLEQGQAKASSAAEQDYKALCGADYKAKMQGISNLLSQATDAIGLRYTDDKGESRSKLNDCLDAIQVGKGDDATMEIRQIGNKVPVMQLLSWIHETFLQEGEPITGGEQGGGESGFFDYKTEDKG